ncbi:copper amine oxidase N-terminal domain-containing protein [Tumebacillus sp. DT12]|uniref:Copper amine oxidase N-terminal domain-containing protein n=1 Tax=Tumebacillus lacus TaxID=2995335 RepID=A0ABT3X665_9BACL|nr:copper amine oxidase N-terminal domain-containing protein [Tumebacillus lacus]MCX7571075.1 copper amine oxidase N-terminal domain-containing protein [Tumebacillus lacus]
MKNKKFATALLAAGLVFGTAGAVQANASDVNHVNFNVIVEDKELTVDPQPFVVDNRTFVPLRSLSEGLGADVQYDSNTNIATISKDDIVLKLNFNTGVVTKNGAQIEINPAPRFVNYRTMVPVRFISEAFGNEVTWDASTSTVNVLPTAKTLAKRTTILDVLTKSTEATNKQEYTSLDLQLKGTIPTGTFDMKMEGPMWMKYSKNPLLMAMGADIEGKVFNQTQKQSFTMYMGDGRMYMKDPTGVWTKEVLPEEDWKEIVDMTRTGGVPTNTEATQNVALPYFTMAEDADSYNLTLKIDQKGLDKLLKAAGESGQPGMPMNPIQMEGGKQSMKVYYEIDKASYLQTNLSLHMEMEMPEMGTMKMDLTGKASYGPVTITIPEEAKNAKSASEL